MTKKVKKTKQTSKKQNNQKVIYESPTSTNDEAKKLGIFIVIIILLFGLFYALSTVIDHKDKKVNTKSEQNAAVIQYDEIILGTLLTQSSENYYVLALSDDQNDSYSSYMTTYKAKENAWKIYTSDLESPFNKRYVVTKEEKSNLNFDSVSELRIKEDTLFKVENHEVTEVFEGKEAILEQLKTLNEE